MHSAADEEVFELAENEDRVLVSSDTRPEDQASLLLDHISELREPLQSGSVVVVEETRLRIRDLPI